MSGHSKWHSIKHKKGAADAARGKVFTKHAKLITVAAREGGDPDMNPALRSAIENARKDNMPNKNIERAIKKGTGEDKDGAQIEEFFYEGYGPEGIAMMVQVLTDNKNRSVSSVRSIFTKNGGNLGENGCVAWMFERIGLISVKGEGKDQEELELSAIDAGANDISIDGERVEIHTDPTEMNEVKDKLVEAGLEVDKAELSFNATQTVEITEKEKAEKILKLFAALEEDDDVTNVYGNFDLTDEVMSQLA